MNVLKVNLCNYYYYTFLIRRNLTNPFRRITKNNRHDGEKKMFIENKKNKLTNERYCNEIKKKTIDS